MTDIRWLYHLYDSLQKYLGRISVDRVEMTPKGLRLMETVYWDFRKEPHLLISGNKVRPVLLVYFDFSIGKILTFIFAIPNVLI